MDLTRFIKDRLTAPLPNGRANGTGIDRKHLAWAAVIGIVVFPFLPFMSDYWIDIGFYAGIYALLGLSLNIVLGEVGLFDLGHTAFYAIGAYTTAILNTRFQIPILILLPLSALIAGLFAWLVTAPVIHLKGDYLCIVTIGIGEIVRLSMINNPFNLTGGPNGINGIDTPHFFIPLTSSRHFYFLIWIVIAFASLALTRLQRSRAGRAWNYIRDDEVAAEALGVDVRRHKLSAFVLGAALAGVAGNIYASKQMSVSPESFTFMESALLFCIVLLGGLGSIPGTMLGALAITIFPEIFRPFAKYRLMFFGLALLVMMIFKPAGFLPRRRTSEKSSELDQDAGQARIKIDPPSASPLLEIESVQLSFGGVSAVAGISASIKEGSITALIGPNGAGKTTLFNLITGIYTPQRGLIRYKGRRISGKKPHQIVALGIARTFQNIRIFPNLNCLENVLCGQHCRGRSGLTASIARTASQVREEKNLIRNANRCLAKVGLEGSRNTLASSLPYGKRRYLEIARALAVDPQLIVLDEPSSGLNDAETEELAGLLLRIKDEGYTILLIEHDMNLVDMVSDHVIVMQSGAKIAEGPMADIRRNSKVIEAYLGVEEG